ncbi:FeoC-like transcriptional regulator [Crenobacter caeni]|uniref:Helix-turn-helix domain-containing protein n=1 Tax=Crenobacter caeni TaxID=2705474 RepID=A0A6B2KT43_9NEIS|nr:FeoC-like transcriptional regulator [Crenobacter caeni]NDV13416.1 helix-turn-helix domain-containing protein [Crenobacter caeni]
MLEGLLVLTRLRDLLRARPALTLAEAAALMGLPASAVEPMLQTWVRKGKVAVSGASCGGGCSGCASDDCRVYRWQETPVRAVIPLRVV